MYLHISSFCLISHLYYSLKCCHKIVISNNGKKFGDKVFNFSAALSDRPFSLLLNDNFVTLFLVTIHIVKYIIQRKNMTRIILITAIAATGLFANSLTDMATKSMTDNATKSVTDKAKSSVTDKLKDDAMSQAKDKAADVAAGEAEKAVGKETLKKETAKSAIKSVI
ncbi:hypothetical protein SUN_2378 [Sulfurovum sp. NBC37-1]|nr:hypothetical protein SUN_2378 [Sulfurovum sp. NBC37-1]